MRRRWTLLAGAAALSAATLLLFAPAVMPSGLPGSAPLAHADSRVFPTGYWGPLLSCTGNYNDVVPSGVNPGGVTKKCTSFCDILSTGQNVLDFAITISLFVGAPGMVAAGGILLMVGNPLTGEKDNKRSAAKKIIVAAFAGIGITLGSYIILSTFLWMFGNGTRAIKVSWPNIECNLDGAAQAPPAQPPGDAEPPTEGTCSCSGTISAASFLPEGDFTPLCDAPQVKASCSDCANRQATCAVSFESSRSACEAVNSDLWGAALRAGFPESARASLNVSGSCTFTPQN